MQKQRNETMTPETHVKIMGLLMLALTSVNAWLPGRLRWGEELKCLSPLNRQVFVVHAIFVMLITTLLGFLSLAYARELLEGTALARAVVIGLGVFWGARFLVQLVVCAKRSWRGTGTDAVLQFLFAGLCAYFTATCAWMLVQQTGGVS
jgi:hypothetical protein